MSRTTNGSAGMKADKPQGQRMQNRANARRASAATSENGAQRIPVTIVWTLPPDQAQSSESAIAEQSPAVDVHAKQTGAPCACDKTIGENSRG